MGQIRTWKTWRRMVWAWWGAVAAFLLLITALSMGMEHRNRYGEPYAPDSYGYTFRLIAYFSVLPALYWVCSWIPYLQKHHIIQWLLLMPAYAVMVFLYALTALHNSSAAYMLLLWIFLLCGVFHLIFVPIIWSKLK